MGFLSRLLSGSKKNTEQLFKWENTGYGLRFLYPADWNKIASGDCLETYQYLALQQLLETGDAIKQKEGIHVYNEVLCKLDMTTRQILDLPDPWPGDFELVIHGITAKRDFSISLRPISRWGKKTYKPRPLKGPFLEIEGQNYLPDHAQWLALSTVDNHSALSPEKRSEAINLEAMYTIREAVKDGARINLRSFSNIEIVKAEKVGISAIECIEGEIRLVPDIGHDLKVEDIEKRLGQIESGTTSACMRIGQKIVLFDERRLQAVHEILSNRMISARDKRQFFKTPGAFLDAALVDLDLGFSLRVHGATVFQKAYFGYGENESLNWFEEKGLEEPVVIPLEACGSLLKNEEDLDNLEGAAIQAFDKNRDFIQFAEKTILLPKGKDEIVLVVNRLREVFFSQKKHERPVITATDEKMHITVDVDLHDMDLPENLLNIKQESENYNGSLYTDQLEYNFHDYQEEGARWIVGKMPHASLTNKSEYYGGLLADDMGLGKTFMALAAMNVYLNMTKSAKPILAVMPVVLLENWKNEINKVFKNTPFRDVVLLSANGQLKEFRKDDSAGRETSLKQTENNKETSNIRYSLKIGSEYGSSRLDMPGRLVLTNYDTLRDYQFSLCMVDWGCVFFDEAQEIKNPNTIKSRAAKGLKADFRLAMTGTPVENSLSDLWSIFDTVKPGLLGPFQEFRNKYMKPISNSIGNDFENMRLKIGRRLRADVGRHMLRRTKDEKLSGLPKKIVHDGMLDEKYSAIMDGVQLSTYNSIVSAVACARLAGDGSQIRKILLPSLRMLQNVSLHPAFQCNSSLPLAESRDALLAIFDQSKKLSLLERILDEIRERKEKAIIFVINKALQLFLASTLGQKYGLSISIINGDTKSISTTNSKCASRIELIQQFEKKDGFQLICMSPLAAGIGLTVVGANNVIHLERHWNPAKEAQATDRVYRLGATKDVHVYIPILRHPTLKSFDENLNELLGRKLNIKDAVITSNEIQPDDFNFGAVFGTNMQDDALNVNMLQSLDWKHFEALCAILAQKNWGGEAFLTQRSGDRGADVIVEGNATDIIIQCKCSINKFTKSNAVLEPRYACEEYSRHLGRNFSLPVLAVNAPEVDDKVFSRAKELNVTVWDKIVISDLLDKYPIRYKDIFIMLEKPYLNF